MNVRRYEWVWLVGIVLTVALLLTSDWSMAQEVPSEPRAREGPSNSNVEFTAGISGWLMTQGETKWSHDFSRLTYKDDSTNIVQVSGQATALKRWFARGDFGYGTMGSGTLTDDDFSSPRGPLESRTTSNITGNNLWYVNGDIGAKLIYFPNHRGAIGFFTGVQYWRQQHEASGVVQTVCNPDPVNPLCNPADLGQDLAPGQTAITNTATWLSWRLGLDVEYRVTRKFSLEGKFAFKPITSLSNEDIHHLRTTDVALPGGIIPALRQDVSFDMTGTGIGADIEGGARYMLIDRLALSLGYRFWWNRVVDGTITQHPVNFPSSSSNLNDFQTFRHGVTLGVSYTF